MSSIRSQGTSSQQADRGLQLTTSNHHEAVSAQKREDQTTNFAARSHENDFLLPSQGECIPPSTPHVAKSRFFSGWRVGATVSFAVAVTVFIVNLVITICIWQKMDYKVESISTLFEGSCAEARQANIWIHLLINVLSTMLLCASNYCMQVVSAPSREEVDEEHVKQSWLHIGLQSAHNLVRIHRSRSSVWIGLLLSSLPLHLLYNSVFFTTFQANKYSVIPTTEDWLHGEAYNTSGLVNFTDAETTEIISKFETLRINLSDSIQSNDGAAIPRYRNLTTEQCFHQYRNQYIAEVRNVYLIQDGPTVWRDQSKWFLKRNNTGHFFWETNNSSHGGYDGQELINSFPFESTPTMLSSNIWRCASHAKQCNISNVYEIPQDRSKWAPYERPIRYCIIEQAKEYCKLQFNILLAMIVIVSNLGKIAFIGTTLFVFRTHIPLVTLGDAIASFLAKPDSETRGCCLATRNTIELQWGKLDRTGKKVATSLKDVPLRFHPERRNWASACSRRRWFVTYLCFFTSIMYGIMCIGWSMQGMPRNLIQLWNVGFGTINDNNLMNLAISPMKGVILANAPQVILSYLYLAINILYTSMFFAWEWSTYSYDRKALRVTTPRGKQRDTYWLNVPFRFAIPVASLSILFHWLASQSIFMVQIMIPDSGFRDMVQSEQISTCGYSPLAIILTTVIGAVFAIGVIIIGRFRYPAGMPLAGNCSAAISSACHALTSDRDPSLQLIQWGAVSHGEAQADGTEAIGHCTFSSLPVEDPISGRLYA